ncbi:MAG: outer membrane beta-barrel protein [Acidobacteria bacterium]|nr:outer membrane beta-barrel protein [Acidobacteriota bacterium]
MNRGTIACAALALALAASPLAAMTNDFGVFGTYIKPSDADNAWGGGAKARFGFVDLRAAYFTDLTARQAEEACPPFCSNAKPKIKFAPLEAGLVFKFSDWSGQPNPPVSPYIGGGAGYYLLHQVNEGVFGHLNNEWGWYAVGGTDINFNPNFGLMVEFQYRRVRGTVTGPNPSDLNFTKTTLQLGGPGGNVGVVWHF